MSDIRLKPPIRTTIAVPSFTGRSLGGRVPEPKKERADGGAIAWRTLEYSYAEKGRDWFVAIGIIAGALSIASFILGNLLFGMLILISTAAMFLHALRKPAYIHCALEKNGFFVEKIRYAYKDIELFWIHEEKETPVLHLKTKSYFSPYLNIPMRREDVDKIRGFLGKRVAEEEFAEPLSHRLAEALGL